MKLPKISLGWIVALVLLLLGFLVKAMPGFSFSALILWGLSAVAVCYLLLHILGKKHKKCARILRRILTVCLCVGILVAAVTGCFVFRGAMGSPGQDCRYVIVLGAGVNGTTPSQSLQWRIHTAYEYLTANPQVQCIASGGQGPDEAISEAQCIYDHLTARGIDGSRIWLEDRSTSTAENFAFSKALLDERFGDGYSAVYVTNDFHIFRAGQIAHDAGLSNMNHVHSNTVWYLVVPSCLRECVAVLWYWVTGG
jgi:uncharacterized SAM-binding protein YcdF (DUF218 family)